MLETTPASHWRMRLFSALAASPLVRPALLKFYASVSGALERRAGQGCMWGARPPAWNAATLFACMGASSPAPSALAHTPPITRADHTRRLVSVQANAKFSSVGAGPEHTLNVSACLG